LPQTTRCSPHRGSSYSSLNYAAGRSAAKCNPLGTITVLCSFGTSSTNGIQRPHQNLEEWKSTKIFHFVYSIFSPLCLSPQRERYMIMILDQLSIFTSKVYSLLSSLWN
jgi:hypothetical protein